MNNNEINAKQAKFYSLMAINGLFLFLLFLSYAKWGMPIVDCFRGPYLAEHLSGGSILFKDIFHFYGPLAAYFNALLFKIFGIKLEVLYCAGIITALIIINIGYYLARQLLTPAQSCCTILAFIFISLFRPGLFQYFFPYSYEALYGSLMLIVLLLFIVKIFDNENYNLSKSLYICPFILAVCLFLKQDVGISAYLTYYAIIIVLFLMKEVNFKSLFKTISLSIILPLIFFGIFLIFTPFNDLFNGIFPLNIFSDHFVKVYSGFIITWPMVLNTAKMFVFFSITFVVFTSIGYLFSWINSGKIKIPPIIFIVLFVSPLIIILGPDSIKDPIINIFFYQMAFPTDNMIFQWVAVFFVFYLFIFFIYGYKKELTYGKREYIIITLSCAVIFFLFRRFMAVNLGTVSNLFILPAFIMVMHVLYNNIPVLIQKINLKYYNIAVHLFVVILIIINFVHLTDFYGHIYAKVKTERGIYITVSSLAPQLNKAINLVKDTTKPDDTIFTPPEELVINFMAARKNASMYIQQVPGIIKDESALIEELEHNKPVLILISNNNNVTFYGKTHWGIDYMQDTYSWIQKHYTIKGVIAQNNYRSKNAAYNYVINVLVKNQP